MSNEFSNIGNLNDAMEEDQIRAKAVEAALVLINTAMLSNNHNISSIKSLLEGNQISPLADKIVEALNFK